MTVLIDNQNISDNAIGLIACSRHQGYWEHEPNLPFEKTPGTQTNDWMKENIGLGATRALRSSQQVTGHTALCVRLKGVIPWARGWVPLPGTLGSGYVSMYFNKPTTGKWQDDLKMVNDPTTISLEYSVTEKQAGDFHDFWKEHQSDFMTYSFSNAQGYSTTSGEVNPNANCVMAAKQTIHAYAIKEGLRHIVQGMNKIVSPKQGVLMGQIASGELLLVSEAGTSPAPPQLRARL